MWSSDGAPAYLRSTIVPLRPCIKASVSKSGFQGFDKLTQAAIFGEGIWSGHCTSGGGLSRSSHPAMVHLSFFCRHVTCRLTLLRRQLLELRHVHRRRVLHPLVTKTCLPNNWEVVLYFSLRSLTLGLRVQGKAHLQAQTGPPSRSGISSRGLSTSGSTAGPTGGVNEHDNIKVRPGQHGYIIQIPHPPALRFRRDVFW